jgi:hypothetical protein
MSFSWRVALVVGAVGVAANLGAWYVLSHPRTGPRDPMWGLFEDTKISDRTDVAPAFSDALRAHENERISLSGVAFMMPDGLSGDQVRWCVLMPPSRYGCCGISCDPRPEVSVFVDCSSHQWPASGKKQVLVTVEGRLRLDRTAGSWCLSTLEDAVVRTATP